VLYLSDLLGVSGDRRQAAGEEDFPGEAIPEDPQDFMPTSGRTRG
jgi:hypothetical protein